MATMPPLRLALADLSRLFTSDILHFDDRTTNLTVRPREQGSALDEVILAGIKRLMAERIRPPSRPVDIQISEEVAKHISVTVRNITEGARAVVATERTLNRAIVALFCDKAFKKFLRDNIETEFQMRRLNELLSELTLPGAASFASASEPFDNKADAASAAKLVGRPDGIAKNISSWISPTTHRAPPAPTPDLQAAAALLRPYWDRSFNYSWNKTSQSMTVADLVRALCAYDNPAKARAGMNGLGRSDLRFLLVMLAKAAAAGDVRIPQAALSLLRIFAMRIYLQLNAIKSAESIGQSLLQNQAALRALPAGEVTRLANLLARCAVRGGRAKEAIDKYRHLVLDHPDDPEALMNYIVAIYSEDLHEAIRYSKLLLINHYAASEANFVFIGDLLAHNNELEFALAAFHRILQSKPGYADAYIGLANIAHIQGNRRQWEECMARFLKFHALPDITFDNTVPLSPFCFRSKGNAKRVASPLVTVIMTAFNSKDTLQLAVESVLAQTATNLELIIVDDVSTDGTRDLVRMLAQRDSRIEWIFNDRNMGTYPSKNAAIRRANGQYITFHDSDDWMHPERLERHLANMKSGVMCTTSNWVRMDAGGRTIVRRSGPYTHLNPASTFFHKDVFSKLGLFDNVRTGADSEILTRIRHRFGHSAVVDMSNVLAVGLHHEASLTQSGVTAFDEHRYSPVRLAYTEAWVDWHLTALMKGQDTLALSSAPGGRMFTPPSEILP